METEEELTKIVQFLTDRGFDCTQETFVLNSADYSMLMTGYFKGFSLGDLKEIVAKYTGKKIKWEHQ